MTPFHRRVLAVVAKIPRGKTMSYGEVAYRAGSPGAARAVGSLMKANVDPAIPCHRVITASGEPGEYNGGKGEKVRRLKGEGVRMEKGKVVR